MDKAPQMDGHFKIARNETSYNMFQHTKHEQLPIEEGHANTVQQFHMIIKQKRGVDPQLDALLREMEGEIAELQGQLADYHQDMEALYGDDVIGFMASAHVSPDQLADCQNDDDKVSALIHKFLNLDVRDKDQFMTIKDEYKNLPEAQYIQKYREHQWQEESITLKEIGIVLRDLGEKFALADEKWELTLARLKDDLLNIIADETLDDAFRLYAKEGLEKLNAPETDDTQEIETIETVLSPL